MSASYDVLIVGARCAGASLAAHLGRRGASVAVVEASPLASDQPMSTHLVQPPGMDELDRLGVGGRVREQTPALSAARFFVDGAEMRLPYAPDRPAHCLSRQKLDGLLQEAAAAAGADLQPRSRVVGLIRDAGGRVRGVEVRRESGRVDRVHAELVVGADGRSSSVAKLVGAREYLGYDGARASYWAYWPKPCGVETSSLFNVAEQDRSHVLFPTDGDRVLIASAPPMSHAARWRGRHEAAYVEEVRACRPLAPFVEGNAPLGRVRVFAKPRYFFRVAAGPGWALAGDAGHHKEFVIGLGISDALRDASSLASAISVGTDDALESYWRRRDASRIQLYRWGQELGQDDHVTALERLIASRAGVSFDGSDRFARVVDGTLPPSELFPARLVLGSLASASLRGNVRPIGPLAVSLRRAIRARAERRGFERLVPGRSLGVRPQLFDPWSRASRCAAAMG